MASRPSSVDRLPPEIREEIGRLRERGKTIDEILAHLRSLDAEIDISRSALGRHVKSMAQMGERLRRSRAMAEGLARQVGEQQGDQVARLNIELLHSFLTDALASADNPDEGDEIGQEAAAALRNPKGAALFAEAIERLTKASRHNVDFVERLERRAAEKATKEAAKAAETVAKQRGLSGEMVDAIRAGILGVKAR